MTYSLFYEPVYKSIEVSHLSTPLYSNIFEICDLNRRKYTILTHPPLGQLLPSPKCSVENVYKQTGKPLTEVIFQKTKTFYSSLKRYSIMFLLITIRLHVPARPSNSLPAVSKCEMFMETDIFFSKEYMRNQ